MQDKYVGDIGDYAKLTFLRHLTSEGELSLGVVWYAFNGAGERNNDGSIRAYRNYSGIHCVRDCDKQLFDGMAIFAEVSRRKIVHLHSLLEGTAFFDEPLQATDRRKWRQRALEATDGRDVVFLDPDNGIGGERDGISPKHIYIADIEQYWNRGQSVVAYHHLSRKKGGHSFEVWEKERLLMSHFPTASVEKIHFKRGTSRIFFLLIQEKHSAILKRLLNNPTPWYRLTLTKDEWSRQRSRRGEGKTQCL